MRACFHASELLVGGGCSVFQCFVALRFVGYLVVPKQLLTAQSNAVSVAALIPVALRLTETAVTYVSRGSALPASARLTAETSGVLAVRA